jgi:hypothetical protein
MVVIMAILFAREVLQMYGFLGQPQTLEQETWSSKNSKSRHLRKIKYVSPILPTTPIVASNNLVLG